MVLKKQRPWIVLPHSTLQKIDENLWAIENNVPGTSIGRRMCIIKRQDDSLLFFNAIPLDDATLKEVEAWGRPELLVVGHHQHMIDTEAFREKLGLKAYGPKECENKVRERMILEGTLEQIPADSSMDIISVPGTKHGETAIVLCSGGGARVSLLVSDVIHNTPKESTPYLFHLLGFTGGPKVVPAFRLLFTKDKALLKSTIMKWAEIPNLKRLVPFHGTIFENDASGAIRAAAARL